MGCWDDESFRELHERVERMAQGMGALEGKVRSLEANVADHEAAIGGLFPVDVRTHRHAIEVARLRESRDQWRSHVKWFRDIISGSRRETHGDRYVRHVVINEALLDSLTAALEASAMADAFALEAPAPAPEGARP